MKRIVLAADLGGTNLRMAAITKTGEILSQTKKKTPRSDNGILIVETLLNAALECRANLSSCEFVALSVAVPATVDVEKGTVIKAPNLPKLNGYALARTLEERSGTRVILENDANAAAIGENWLGASQGSATSIMVTLGTGVGGGIIIDGKVIRGADGTAGEIGHICVEPNGVECGCGSHGCVEQYASATAVVRIARESFSGSRDSAIAKIDELSSKDVYMLGKQGSEQALGVFRTQGFYLGIVLAGLINSLNPDVIVIGGGAAAGWDLFIPQTKEQIRIRAYRKPAERAKLVRAELGDDAGILGAARLGFDISSNYS